VFLFWMFINASILLLGAEFARAVAGEPDEPPEPEPGPEAPPGVTVRADSRLF
jgi:uncharacterized BrkB/YihY/UPF0761 family membrane protein